MSKNKTYLHQTFYEAKASIFYKKIQQIIINKRDKFFNLFLKTTNFSNDKSIIDIGTTPSIEDEQNIFLEKIKNNLNVTCLSDQDCRVLQQKFKNIKNIIIGDGKNTMLNDNSFDIVHSNATIEHVGSFENQLSLVREMFRISKETVFIQTPNRFHPIEFHTILPIIHWFPKKIHRKILKFFKYDFHSKEENLNLLSVKDLKNICKKLGFKKYEIFKTKLFFFTSNLILVIYK
mgnify:CR=1 FL=1|tara:strand:- start:1150 stop:1848 length:699 start_codon:yes stop_codon:yes gene_type:complete